MRVGVFTSGSEPDSGGAHSFEKEVVDCLVRAAADSKHEFVIFSSRSSPRPDRGTGIDYAVFPPSAARRVLYRIRNRTNARFRTTVLDEVARRNNVDMIWFVGAEAIHTDLPYIATVWDLQHRLQPVFPEVGGLSTWQHRESFLRPFLQRATRIITGTEAGADELMLFYGLPSSRILRIPHPTPRLPAYSTPPAALPASALDSGYVFYPAQFWAHKNHVTLLMAIAELRKRNHGIHLALAGSDKGNLDVVRGAAGRLGLLESVHLLGFVEPSELRFLYENAFALVYPSFFGPENLPPLEAFSMGCPVVAADVSGSAEQLGDAALRVPPQDSVAFADAIERLMVDSQLRSTMIAKGHDRAGVRSGDAYVAHVIQEIDHLEGVRRCW